MRPVPRPPALSPSLVPSLGALLVAALLAGSPGAAAAPPLSVAAGMGAVAGGGGSAAASVGGAGLLRAWGGGAALSADLGVRTGLLANDLRETTTLSLGLRAAPALGGGRPLHARVGFLHAHETPWAVVTATPVQAALGTAPGIRHRTGAELAMGLSGTLLPRETDGRWSAVMEAGAHVFPDAGGPPVYGVVDLGIAYRFGGG